MANPNDSQHTLIGDFCAQRVDPTRLGANASLAHCCRGGAGISTNHGKSLSDSLSLDEWKLMCFAFLLLS